MYEEGVITAHLRKELNAEVVGNRNEFVEHEIRQEQLHACAHVWVIMYG